MSVFKQFRQTKEFSGVNFADRFTFSKRFDEPTYFSFKLQFAPDHDKLYNYSGTGALYDTMPQPLFDDTNDIVTVRKVVNQQTISDQEAYQYSAIDYLINANEPTRAEMLREFISKFNDLQNNFPYYFQQIDGVSELLKIDPTKGQRILNDKKLTITCLEGLDLRMSYLLNLYRKIAWDDVYQRWVLPDMMRYFTLKIYLSEFRVFHLLNDKDYLGSIPIKTTEPAMLPTGAINPNQLAPMKGAAAVPPTPTPTDEFPFILNVMDNALPTWVINCEMCEFDITDINFDHLGGLNVAGDPGQGAVKFGIKIGNVQELQVYPLFSQMFLSDRKLNGINRAKDEISTSAIEMDPTNKYVYPSILQVAQNRISGEVNSHESGLPFNERANQNTTNDTKGAYPIIPAKNLSEATKTESNGQNEETWAGNAINFGGAFLKNTVNKVVDKAKVTPIPKLGFSFTELQGAIQSKNIIDILGLIRKSMTTVTNSYVMPSERLSEDIVDGSFRQLLVSLSTSEATDPTSKVLAEAANVALSDRGVWEKVKDYSLATDLVSSNESNINKTLYGTEQYTETADVPNGVKREIQGDSGISTVDANAVSSGKLQSESLTTIAASANLASKTEGGALSQGTASSKLASSTEGDKLDQTEASNLLSENVTGGMTQETASSGLSSKIQGQVNVEAPNKRTTGLQVTPGVTQGAPGIKTTTIEVGSIIEAEPTTSMYKKIEGDPLSQPAPSKATTNKLEKTN